MEPRFLEMCLKKSGKVLNVAVGGGVITSLNQHIAAIAAVNKIKTN